MRKLILSFLLSSKIIFSQTALLDTNSILIGQQVIFTISNSVSESNSWPTYTNFLIEGIEIIQEGKIDTINNIISQNFIITSWDSGSYYIPEISFSENSKTEGLLLNVQSVFIEQDAKLKDIKKPLRAPIDWRDISPWIIGLLLTILTIYIIRKNLFNSKQKTKRIDPKILIPSNVIALEQLIALENAKIWQAGRIKEYHSKISEIIRRYTENRFDFIALELATDEIISQLKNKVDNQQLSSITILLQRADLAKFAKSNPSDDENKESMQLAKYFIHETKANITNG